MDNAQQQTIQGKPVTEPEKPLQIFLVGNVNLIQGSAIVINSIQYSTKSLKYYNSEIKSLNKKKYMISHISDA